MMEDGHSKKCPWCSVYLSGDGSCPNPIHPAVCPFCGAVLTRDSPQTCPDECCASNAVQPTRMHSSFPPATCGIRELSEQSTIRLARLYEMLLSVRYSSSGLIEDSLEEDDAPTNPAIPSIYPGSSGNSNGASSSSERKNFSSGVYPLVRTAMRRDASNS